MTVEEKIRLLIAQDRDEGFANACEIWKGYGDSGQTPRGWWYKPFNETGIWLGTNWKEVKELW